MEVKDIPSDMMKDIRLRFESNPDVMQLRTQQQYAQRSGNYALALDVAQKLDALFVVVLDKYMRHAEQEVKTLDSAASALPLKDKEDMMVSMMVMFMACDIIDTAVMDLNDVLHRTYPDFDISTFNDIKQTADMARKKLKYLQENGDYMQDLVWADSCDNMYDMMRSKAKAIVRKRKESKNWGDNMKRLVNGGK